jgi:lambda repressor-like predicted transcriptional regulator
MNLVAERLNRGLSVSAFAHEAGVPEHVVRHAEKGGVPQPANAFKIASFLGVRVTDIWPTERDGAAA